MSGPALHYFLGNALHMALNLGGLVVFARLFTPAEYGRLSVVTATIGLLAAAGTVGLPQSAVRYHWDFMRRGELPTYHGTLLHGALGAALAVTVVTTAVSRLGEGRFWAADLAAPLAVAGVVIGLTCLAETLMNLFRAGQASGTYSVALVLGRAAALLGSVVAVVGWGGRVVAYLWGQAAGEVLLLGFLLFRLGGGRIREALGRFDRGFFLPRSGTASRTCWPSSGVSC